MIKSAAALSAERVFAAELDPLCQQKFFSRLNESEGLGDLGEHSRAVRNIYSLLGKEWWNA